MKIDVRCGETTAAFTRLWDVHQRRLTPTVASIITAATKARHTRSYDSRAVYRGEYNDVISAYGGLVHFAEFKELCEFFDTNYIWLSELHELYKHGKIETSPSTING